MNIIEPQKIEVTKGLLAQGVTLNTYVGILFTGIADIFNSDDLKELHVSVEASTDGITHSITVNTPHGTIVGIAEHAKSEGHLVAKISFVTVRVNADGQTTPSEIMTLTVSGYGFVTDVDGDACSAQFGVAGKEDATHDIAWRLLSNLHDKLLADTDLSFFSL
ncbi:hypothetical protein [Burkholderia cepacia]|uniref:hypothetical protein n=1 Tax=Burkholderia cepacia TaxID=292 RepID=UPI000AF116AE|nr:hypothetical protein [Burkholderia cepacia]